MHHLARRDFVAGLLAQDLPDIRGTAPDLTTPTMTTGEAQAGKRVRQTIEPWRGSEVYHTLYLPRDYRPGQRYPLLVEYAGNGNYRNQYGDVSTGVPEGSNLGYGISGGEGFVWLCLPYVNSAERRNEIRWWGDAAATVAYAKRAVRETIERYSGDASRVVLMGFSRGAIGCGYLGLHDDEIAALWRGFIAYSHFEGVRQWGWEKPGEETARQRLERLKGRPVYVIHERSVEETRRYIESAGAGASFTFRALGFRNHNDAWTLRDCPERRELRAWLRRVLDL